DRRIARTRTGTLEMPVRIWLAELGRRWRNGNARGSETDPRPFMCQRANWAATTGARGRQDPQAPLAPVGPRMSRDLGWKREGGRARVDRRCRDGHRRLNDADLETAPPPEIGRRGRRRGGGGGRLRHGGGGARTGPRGAPDGFGVAVGVAPSRAQRQAAEGRRRPRRGPGADPQGP